MYGSYAEYKFWLKMQEASMYEVGRYFLQHKFVVRRCKHKRSRRRK